MDPIDKFRRGIKMSGEELSQLPLIERIRHITETEPKDEGWNAAEMHARLTELGAIDPILSVLDVANEAKKYYGT